MFIWNQEVFWCHETPHLAQPSVCYIMPVGVHIPLPKYPSGDWQLVSRSRSRCAHRTEIWRAGCGWTGKWVKCGIRNAKRVKVHITAATPNGDVTKHRIGRTVRTGAKYRSWVLVTLTFVWCGVYYWFRLRKGTGYDFHAFLTCILLLLQLIQCKISLYLRPVRTVRPVRCFVTPPKWSRNWPISVELVLLCMFETISFMGN